MKTKKHKKKTIKIALLGIFKPFFWFFVGFSFAFFCLATFILVYFKIKYHDRVIPGVFMGNTYVGEKTSPEVKEIFDKKNAEIGDSKITFKLEDKIATVSAKDLSVGYNSNLIAQQSLSLGKSNDAISNIYQITNSYLNGIYLSPSLQSDIDKIENILSHIKKEVHKDPVNAYFNIGENRVIAFKESQDGITIDFEKLKNSVASDLPQILNGRKDFIFKIPLKILEPEITTEEANSYGIEEEIGYGSSKFAGSIPNRIYNISLAASRINGILLSPGEEFSFARYLGDVSKFTGYKEAYVIQNGKTVLGDGGGVCQVSTTLFRAVLNAGLPITERHAHAYRVGYYEQDTGPGVDATVYVPTVDLKFVNDTGKHILIQSHVDPSNMAMSFTFYGKKDGREVTITDPVITNQTPAPEPEYQDDPNLSVGVVKQIDYAAAGARTSFIRTVTKDGKVISNDVFDSIYRPWRAVFLRGTKQG